MIPLLNTNHNGGISPRSNTTGVKQILDTMRTKTSLNISLTHSMVSALKPILWIVKLLSLGICILSSTHHWQLHTLVNNYKTTEEYFLFFLPEISNFTREQQTEYFSGYSQYRYIIGIIHADYQEDAKGLFVVHRLMHGASFLLESRLQKPNQQFCDLHEFPNILMEGNLIATPDSHYSTIVLAISTFLWGAYLALLVHKHLLEKEIFNVTSMYNSIANLEYSMELIHKKRLEIISWTLKKDITLDSKKYLPKRQCSKMTHKPRWASKCVTCSVAFLLNILGIYTFKKTKIDLDSYQAYIWEMVKAICILVIDLI